MPRRPSDVLAAGLAGAVVSGFPSTVWTLVEGGDPLDGARALGRVLLPRSRSTPLLLAAGAPVHLALSLGWAAALAPVLPRDRRGPVYGAAAGLAIAALDLGVIGRRIPAIRALPQPRQWADHVAFGTTVGAVLTIRACRSPS